MAAGRRTVDTPCCNKLPTDALESSCHVNSRDIALKLNQYLSAVRYCYRGKLGHAKEFSQKNEKSFLRA